MFLFKTAFAQSVTGRTAQRRKGIHRQTWSCEKYILTEDLATGTSGFDHEQHEIGRLTAYTGTMVAANAVETGTGFGLITHLIHGWLQCAEEAF